MFYYLPLIPDAKFETIPVDEGEAERLAPELFEDDEENIENPLLRMTIEETYLRDPKRTGRTRLPEEDPSAGDVVIAESSVSLEKAGDGKSFGILKVLEVRTENKVRVFSILVAAHTRHDIGDRKTWGRGAPTPENIDNLVK